MRFLTNLNLLSNELQNAVIQVLATSPTTGKIGQIYYNSADKALMQYDGTEWKKVGVVYQQGSTTGAVITGLDDTGNVTTTNVVGLTLTGYTPVEGGYVSDKMALGAAIKALDTAVQNAVSGGGEVNQNAWSNISVKKQSAATTAVTGAAASAPSVNYNITRNLTNCASSNTADTIAEGAVYTTTLSPTGTYKKLGTITVTMGGTDISSTAVSGSTITISKVTGNIVIICAAEITNIIDTIGISANTRLSTSSGENRAQDGYASIGANKDAVSLIHLVAGDTLRIKGVSLPASDDNYSAIVLYNASGAFNVSNYLHNGFTWNNLTFNNADGGVTITSGGDHYFRVSLICADASVVIATINEEIE